MKDKEKKRRRHALFASGISPLRVLRLQPWEAGPLGQVGGGVLVRYEAGRRKEEEEEGNSCRV